MRTTHHDVAAKTSFNHFSCLSEPKKPSNSENETKRQQSYLATCASNSQRKIVKKLKVFFDTKFFIIESNYSVEDILGIF